MLAILILGIVLFSRGETTVGGIVMFMSFAGMLIQRMEQSFGFANRLFADAPRLEEFFARVRHRAVGRAIAERALTLDKIRGAVAFERVTFSYDGRSLPSTDLSFAAEPGEIVALVGATGAGKSTAMALLYRVYDPQSGSIRIDGRDIRDIKLASLRRQYRRDLPGTPAVQPVDRRESPRRQSGRHRCGHPSGRRARASRSNSSSGSERA